MSPEIANLEHKIEVSRRIIAKAPAPDEDEIIHSLIVSELIADIPRLERRIVQLKSYGPDRRKS